jgi:prophage regulatory protein
MTTSEILRRDKKRKEAKREARAGRRILRLPEVVERTGLPVSSIYEQMNTGTFPRSVSIGTRAVGWVEDEVAAWVESRITERDASAA